jgi:hypothetical protein
VNALWGKNSEMILLLLNMYVDTVFSVKGFLFLMEWKWRFLLCIRLRYIKVLLYNLLVGRLLLLLFSMKLK